MDLTGLAMSFGADKIVGIVDPSVKTIIKEAKHFPFTGRLRDASCTMERRPLDNIFLPNLLFHLVHKAAMNAMK